MAGSTGHSTSPPFTGFRTPGTEALEVHTPAADVISAGGPPTPRFPEPPPQPHPTPQSADPPPISRSHRHHRRKRTGVPAGPATPPVGDEELRCQCEGPEAEKEVRRRAVQRCFRAACKGFVIGAGLKGGLALFGLLAKMRKTVIDRGRQHAALAAVARPLIRTAVKETWRYGLFLGAFAGGFSAVDEALAAIFGHYRSMRWRSLLAGAAAGPALLLTGRNTRHTSMALYILLRAAVLGARCGLKSKRWGWLFSPLGWRHGDVFLMCLSSLQILSAYILKPSTLPKSYVSFLNKHVGKDQRIVERVGELAGARPLKDMDALSAVYTERGIPVTLDSNMKIPCEMVHPNQACTSHILSFFPKAYLRALPVYLPVYLIPALLVHRHALIDKPLPILGKLVLGTARSSFFLASYIASAWMWTCAIHQTTQTCSPVTLAAGTFPCGLAVLFEKKSRRMELALYCLSRALESFGLCLDDWGYLHRLRFLKRMDVVLFSIATALIMHCYAQERDVFRSKYLNVLDWVFGVPGLVHKCTAPSCKYDGATAKAGDSV